MRKNSPFEEKNAVTLRYLLTDPLICSRINIPHSIRKDPCLEWFVKSFEKRSSIRISSLIYNAALMLEAGIGYALELGVLIDPVGNRELCLHPLEPRLESGLNIVRKKFQVFSKAAELFRERLLERFFEQEER